MMLVVAKAKAMLFAEKAQLLQLLARDFGGGSLGIEWDTEISGGEPRIAGTRIPVWLLVQYRKLGASEADLLRAYPMLRAGDLANAWAFYRANKEGIERQIIENETA